MEDAAFQATPAFEAPAKKSRKRFYYLLIIIVFLILIFVLYSRTFNASTKKENSRIAPTPSVKQELTATPTPEVTKEPEETTPTVKPTKSPIDKASGLNRSKLSIVVQNGSGVEGTAGKTADFLKELGYKIASTENADNFDYTGVVISVKSGSSDFLELLEADLKNKYDITSSFDDLSATISADALVIIGK
jgi:hypothetical protein